MSTVKNVAPAVALALATTADDREHRRPHHRHVTDPGWLDPLTATIKFGDGAADDDTVGNCKTANATVTNVNPTAVIELVGTTVVNGTPTFVAHVGQSIPFKGTSADRGATTSQRRGTGTTARQRRTCRPRRWWNPPTPDLLPSPSVLPRNITDRCHRSGR